MKPQFDMKNSSGTTGHPKGVMLTHKNIVSNILMQSAVEWDRLSPKNNDKILAFLPFYHIYGLTCLVHQSITTGVELVVMPKFDLERFCENVQKHKITFAYVVPPVVLMLGKSPIVDKYDFSSIRMMNSGAAPLTKEIVGAVYDRLKIPVKQGYGLSETSPTTHTQRWDDWKIMGSVGKLLPNQVAMYMDPEEKEVAVGQTGELWIKGPNIFLGYLNNQAGTDNALTKDGYFKTGDVGYQDKEGNFYITDRVKELIKYKGFQVYIFPPPISSKPILTASQTTSRTRRSPPWPPGHRRRSSARHLQRRPSHGNATRLHRPSSRRTKLARDSQEYYGMVEREGCGA